MRDVPPGEGSCKEWRRVSGAASLQVDQVLTNVPHTAESLSVLRLSIRSGI